MYRHAEINIENIKPEACPGSESISGLFTVDGLSLVMDIISEYTERYIERDIFHHHDTKARRESETCVHISSFCKFRDAVVWACKSGATGREGEFHLIVNTEAAFTSEANILTREYSGGIRFGPILNIFEGEVKVVVEVDVE